MWHIEEIDGEFCVINDDSGTSEGCHESRADAMEQIAALVLAAAEAERAAGGEAAADGESFTALLAIEGFETADGRMFELDSITWRDPPIPLMVQDTNPEWGGHTGAWFAGQITAVWRDETEPTRIMGAGVLLSTEKGVEAAAMIRGGLRGVSVDASGNDVLYDVRAVDQDGWPTDVLARFQDGRLMGATVTPFAAFEETTLWLSDEEPPPYVTKVAGAEIPRTETPEIVDDGMGALYASAPALPPADWFSVPEADELTPLVVTDDGQVYGHIAEWHTCHIGYDVCVTAPASPSNYAYFHLGAVACADGQHLPVGQLTLGTGHAAGTLKMAPALAHYDDTGTAVADVRAVDGKFGPWVCGALRPGATEEQVRVLRGSKPSGDWRHVNGYLEMIAVLAVNVPGFPVLRPEAVVASGVQVSLVAAPGPTPGAAPHQGTVPLTAEHFASVLRRLTRLESATKPLLGLAAERIRERIRT